LAGILTPPTVLVDADDISTWIAKSRGDLRRIRSDGLHDLAAMGCDCRESGLCVINHEVDQETGLRGRRKPKNPPATDFADSIVERDLALVALPDIPTEYISVKLGRAGDVSGGNLDVTNLAVSKCWWHQ
jgi:hypothetical protein